MGELEEETWNDMCLGRIVRAQTNWSTPVMRVSGTLPMSNMHKTEKERHVRRVCKCLCVA